MKIKSIRAFALANVYSHKPVLMMQFDVGESKGKESREMTAFNARLLERLPGLKEHYCDLNESDGFIKRLNEGTYFNRVIEHVTQELLALAGIGDRLEKVCFADKRRLESHNRNYVCRDNPVLSARCRRAGRCSN